MKLVSMKRTAAERKEDGKDGGASGGKIYGIGVGQNVVDDGVKVHLEHHHIQKMGMDGPLPHGSTVRFEGHGEVGESGTHVGPDGEPIHHMTLHLHKAGIEGDEAEGPDVARSGLKDELRKNMDAVAGKKSAPGRDGGASGAKMYGKGAGKNVVDGAARTGKATSDERDVRDKAKMGY